MVLSFDFVVDDLETADLLYHFSVKHKRFPFCLKKMDISPNVVKPDVSTDIWAFRDEEWGKAKRKMAQNSIIDNIKITRYGKAVCLWKKGYK